TGTPCWRADRARALIFGAASVALLTSASEPSKLNPLITSINSRAIASDGCLRSSSTLLASPCIGELAAIPVPTTDAPRRRSSASFAHPGSKTGIALRGTSWTCALLRVEESVQRGAPSDRCYLVGNELPLIGSARPGWG